VKIEIVPDSRCVARDAAKVIADEAGTAVAVCGKCGKLARRGRKMGSARPVSKQEEYPGISR